MSTNQKQIVWRSRRAAADAHFVAAPNYFNANYVR